MEGHFKKLNILLAGLLFGLVFLIFIPAKVFGAVGTPKILNHQGRLFDASENPLGGSGTDYCFKFSIYDNAMVGSGVKLWPTGTTSVMVVNVKSGVFNAGIGDTAAGGDALDYNFQDSDSIFLNVEVGSQSGGSCAGTAFENLSPRQRVFSSGYAINADTIDGFHAAQSASGNQIPALTSGNLILGGVNPQLNAISSSTLTLQGGSGVGDIQFFSSANKITSAGALTLAGGITAGASTLSNLAVTNFSTSSFAGPLVIGGGSPTATVKLRILGGGIGLDNSQRIVWRNSVNTNDTFVIDMSGDTAFLRGGGGNPTLRFDNTSGNPIMTLLESGNIGIGTTTPKEKIHLAGGSFLQDSPTDPKVIGGQNLVLPGGGLQLNFVSGRYAYMIFDNPAGTNILRIVDATDPANPAVVGGAALSLPGSPRSIYVAGRYAYMVFRNITGTDIFRIIDISNPANPAVVGGGSLSLPANGQHVFVSGHYAYLTFDNGAGASTFRVIDISNSANPVVVGGAALSLPTSPRQIYVSGRYAYVAFYSTINTDALRIIDISDPKNPAVVGGSALSLGFSTWSIYISGRYAYIGFDNTAGTDIFRIVDISNPANPAVVGGSALSLPGFAKSIFVSGRYVYIAFDNAAGANGFRIIDAASASAPAIVGGANLSLPGFPKSVFVNGRYAYFVFFQGAGTDTFRIVDISGIEVVSALVHSLEAGSLQVSANAQIQNQLAVGGGININGGGLFASGGIGINGESLFAPLLDSTTTFRVQNAAGSETLFTADTANNRFKIGDDDTAGNPTTLLVIDSKADAGDPAGTNGATYYNTNAQKFRCFENGGWKNCDTAGAGGTTFQSYSLLRDAVGVTMTNAASGGTEITNLVSRSQIDFTGMTNVRAQFAHSLNSATIKLRIDFSTSSCAAFNAMPLVSAFGAAVGADNIQTSSFAVIPTAAKADVCVRAVIIGNGVLDPIVRYITLGTN